MATPQGVAVIHLEGLLGRSVDATLQILEVMRGVDLQASYLLRNQWWIFMTLQAHTILMTLKTWVEDPTWASGKSPDPYWITCVPNARGWQGATFIDA